MRNNIKTIILIFSICFFIQPIAKGQIDNVYRQYYLHNELANPAFTGLESYPVLNLSIKRQWLDIENAPQLQIISYSQRINEYGFYNPKKFVNKSKIKTNGRVGVGAIAFSDKIGPQSTMGGKFMLAYHFPINAASLSVASALSFYQSKLNEWLFEPKNTMDPLLNYKTDKYSKSGLDVGINYSNKDFFAGLSFPQLIILKSSYYKMKSPGLTFSVFSGYLLEMNRKVAVEPSVNFSYKTGEADVEIFGKIHYRNNWFAISYNHKNNINAYISAKLSKIHIGYCYSYLISEMFNYKPGNHQVFLGLNYGIKRGNRDTENIMSLVN